MHNQWLKKRRDDEVAHFRLKNEERYKQFKKELQIHHVYPTQCRLNEIWEDPKPSKDMIDVRRLDYPPNAFKQSFEDMCEKAIELSQKLWAWDWRPRGHKQIVINGKEFNVHGNYLTYEQVVVFARENPSMTETVTYHKADGVKSEGVLRKDEVVSIKNGTSFDAYDTNCA